MENLFGNVAITSMKVDLKEMVPNFKTIYENTNSVFDKFLSKFNAKILLI